MLRALRSHRNRVRWSGTFYENAKSSCWFKRRLEDVRSVNTAREVGVDGREHLPFGRNVSEDRRWKDVHFVQNERFSSMYDMEFDTSAYHARRGGSSYDDSPKRKLRRAKCTLGDKGTSSTLKEDVANELLGVIEEINSDEFPVLFNCLKKGNFYHRRLIEDMTGRMLESREMLQNYSMVQLSMVIHSIAVLWRQFQFDSSFFRGFRRLVKALVSECLRIESSGSYDEQGMANIMYGFGLIFKVEEGLAMDDQAVSVVQGILNKVGEAKSLDGFLPQHFSNILYGCACMDQSNPEVLNKMCVEIEKRMNVLETPQKGDVVCDEHGVADERIVFSPQAVSNIIWSLGKLGHQHKGVLDVMSRFIMVKTSLFREQHIANILYGFGKLGYVNSKVLAALSRDLAYARKLTKFNNLELSHVLYGLGKLGYKNDLILPKISEELMRPARLHKLSDKCLFTTIYAFGMLKYSDQRLMKWLSKEICRPHRLKRYNHETLSTIKNGFKRMNYTNALLTSVFGKISDAPPMKHDPIE